MQVRLEQKPRLAFVQADHIDIVTRGSLLCPVPAFPGWWIEVPLSPMLNLPWRENRQGLRPFLWGMLQIMLGA